MKVTKIFTFEAAHYLPGHPTCGHVYGHSYKLEVTVKGQPNNSGMVIDFHELKAKVNDVLANYDHTLLNNFIETPTVEHIAICLYQEIKDAIPDLCKVRLWETATSYAEYEGE